MSNYGYAGRILRVDLTRGDITTEPTMKYADRFVGGRGINSWIIFNELEPEVKPLDPENILTFGVGPLVGTLSPFSSRVSIDTKNAFTHGVGSANCGGHFGAEMKYTGFDNLVITGRSDEPVYLWLNDGDAELRDAKDVWGKTTWDTERTIRAEQRDNEVRVIGIGPAGENHVKSACIISDRAKAAGGSGVGAVMGSKNLKVVAARGSLPIKVAEPDRFINAVDIARAQVEGFPKAKLYRKDGYYGVESYYGSPAWDAELRDAKDVWGKTTWDTERTIRAEQRDNEVRVIGIGPAGENQVKSACIISDRAKAAGGSGVGAVMGSKNLKAVAARGSLPIKVAEPERFINAVDIARAQVEGFPKAKLYRKDGYYGVESYYGSPAWDAGFRPVRNGQDDYWEQEKIKKVSGDAMNKYRKKILACYGCPVGCMPWMVVADGPYKVAGEGWWNNSSNSFCTRVDCDNPEAAIKAHLRTNQLGLDSDNASVVISWAFECFERGIITKEDTDGLELNWGNHDAVLALLDKIANREGFGDVLADGVKEASEKLGKNSQEFALHIKGQDTVDGIRISKGWGFGVVTSPAAGRHLRGAIHSFSPEKFLSWDRVAYRVFMQEQFKAILDMTGTCLYNNGLLSWETNVEPKAAHHISELTSSLTGMDLNVDRFMSIGRQVHNLEKAFNTLHGGFSRKDDYPPKRFWEEPVKSGPYKGEHLDHDTWNHTLDEYYTLHGWEMGSGLQTRETLRSLGLDTVANRLESVSLLR